MKTFPNRLLPVVIVCAFSLANVQAQNGTVQIINNSIVQGGAIDVYVDGALIANDLPYRTATAGVAAAAGTRVFAFARSTSTSVADAFWTDSAQVIANSNLIAIAQGLESSTGYAPNPDGLNTAFTSVFFQKPAQGQFPTHADVYFVNGITDAPMFDLRSVNGYRYTDNTPFGGRGTMASVPAGVDPVYAWDASPAGGSTTYLLKAIADFTGNAGQSFVVVASGFLVPAANQNGPAAALIAFAPNGTALPFLPAGQNGGLTVVHNMADPAVTQVDIYVESTRIGDDVNFRGSVRMPQLSVGSHTITFAPSTSTSNAQGFLTKPVTISDGLHTIAVASGVLSGPGPTTFTPNPDGIAIDYDIKTLDVPLGPSSTPDANDAAYFNGATDSPTINADVVSPSGGRTKYSNVAFQSGSSFETLGNHFYLVELVESANPTHVIGTYDADLKLIADKAGVLIASGFLDPALNANGPALELLAVFTDGTTATYNIHQPTGWLQFIHSSATMPVRAVDVYYKNLLIANDLNFAEATDFIDVGAGGGPLHVAPANSTSIADAFFSSAIAVPTDDGVVVTGLGLRDTVGYKKNPVGFGIDYTEANYVATLPALIPNQAHLAFIGWENACTDVSDIGIKIYEAGNPSSTVANFATDYKVNTPPVSAQPNEYIVEMTANAPGISVKRLYELDLRNKAGTSLTIFTGGFLDSAANKNGPGLRLYAAFADGTVIPLPLLPQQQNTQLQIVNNIHDPAHAMVDVYIGTELFANDLVASRLTPWLTAPSSIPASTPQGTHDATFRIAPSNSTSFNDAFAILTVTVTLGNVNVIVLNGVDDPTGFTPNPNGKNINASASVFSFAPPAPSTGVHTIFAHGATDVPGVHLNQQPAARLVSDAEYGSISGIYDIDAAAHVFEIVHSADTTLKVGTFDADFNALGNETVVLYFGGYTNPIANHNGRELGLWAGLSNGTSFELSKRFDTPTTIQFIHNAPDPSIAAVDIYIDGVKEYDDFAFRSATAFMEITPDVQHSIAIATSGSLNAGDAFFTTVAQFDQDVAYAALLHGVLAPAQFADNPDGIVTAFGMLLQDGIRRVSQVSSRVDVIGMNGITDGPTADLRIRGESVLLNNLSYGDISSYLSAEANQVVLDLLPAPGGPVIASFDADFTPYNNGAMFLFLSGFDQPAQNQNGSEIGLFGALPNGTVVTFPKRAASIAEMQFINNSADPNNAYIDVYVNDTLFLDNLAFRTATALLDLPAGRQLRIGVAPQQSSGPIDIMATTTETLTENARYFAMISGVIETVNFAPNPDSKPIGIAISTISGLQVQATQSSNFDMIVVHGATDAPTMDLRAANYGQLVNNTFYGAISNYVRIPADEYILHFTGANDTTQIIAAFRADLATRAGESAVAFLSGFRNPAANQDGNAMGLFAAFPNGNVIEFPLFTGPGGRAQFIHNSPDSSLAVVDVYYNNVRIAEDLGFHQATPFLSIPEGTGRLGLAPSTSVGVADTMVSFPVPVADGGSYILMTLGVRNPGAYKANPDNYSTALRLAVFDSAQESASNPNLIDLARISTVTDVSSVDFYAENIGTMLYNASYGEFAQYQPYSPGKYLLSITPTGLPDSTIAAFDFDVRSLANVTGVLFSAGFFDQAANNNGERIGLFLALPDGTVFEFNPENTNSSFADIQIAHNSADPAFHTLDVYLDDQLYLNDFSYPCGTPLFELEEGTHQIAVAPLSSGSVNDAFATFTIDLVREQGYLFVLSGLLDTLGYMPNPDGRTISARLIEKQGLLEFSPDNGQVALLFAHGVTDAPSLDVLRGDGSSLFAGQFYGSYDDYELLDPALHKFSVVRSIQDDTIAVFTADLRSVQGLAGVALLSGFMEPQNNKNGLPLEMNALFADGSCITMQAVNAADRIPAAEGATFSLYPNPAQGPTNAAFSLTAAGAVEFLIYNTLGELIARHSIPRTGTGEHVTVLPTRGLPPGLYNVVLRQGSLLLTRRLALQ